MPPRLAPPVEPQILAEMIDYYRARAGEYDQWFYRQGRYDRGEENNRHWFAESEHVFAALDGFKLNGDVLELACGTGIWTQRLVRFADSVTAVDASSEVIAINRHKIADRRVQYELADLFAWEPPRQFDGVFFGFWMSHVPRERLDGFWQIVARALRPGGKVFFVDSRCSNTSAAVNHQHTMCGQLQNRKLDNGEQFTIVKIFYRPDEVIAAAARAGIEIEVHATNEYFIYGTGQRTA